MCLCKSVLTIRTGCISLYTLSSFLMELLSTIWSLSTSVYMHACLLFVRTCATAQPIRGLSRQLRIGCRSRARVSCRPTANRRRRSRLTLLRARCRYIEIFRSSMAEAKRCQMGMQGTMQGFAISRPFWPCGSGFSRNMKAKTQISR